ncbi:MAG: hypothetical protein IJX87_03225 [Clostridia bacterium]|nr:hypothetical protein [Clostridia bacterium]
MKAQWIWKGKDFEFYIYNKMSNRRRERNVPVNVMWAMPAVDPRAHFLLTNIELEEETTIRLYAEGEMAVRVDVSPTYAYDFNGVLTLPAGTHTISVEVYNPGGLPCLYVDGKGCESGANWEVYGRNGLWGNASCNGLFDVTMPPSAYGLPTRENFPVSQEEIVAADGRKGVLYSFDKEVLAFPKFVNVESDGEIEAYYGESREEALDPAHSEACDRFMVKTGDFIGDINKAFRYVFVPSGGAVYERFLCLEEYYPMESRGKFVCNDERLKRIYDISLYTLALTSREFFIDGIKRDRWVWAGDTIQSIWMSLYSYFDKELIKRTIVAMLGKEKFYHHVNGIMDYSFYLLLSVREYYRYTGDEAFVKEVYPQMKELLTFCLSRRNANGLMQRVAYEWVFVDWADFPVDGELCVEQILLYESLLCAADLGEKIGEPHEEWRTIAENVRAQINEKYWTDMGFAHDETKTLMTRYGGIFAAIYGLANEAQRQVILQKTLIPTDVQAIKTPYMKFYEMSAIAELGDIQTMLEYVKSYWGGMIDEGATAFWEEYDPTVKGAEKYAMYGRKYGKSLCHSWGASPLYLLGRYVVGLKPDGAGYRRFSLKPYMDGKLFYEAELPANEGYVQVKYDGETLVVFSDKKDGTVYADGKTYQVKAGETLRISVKIKE